MSSQYQSGYLGRDSLQRLNDALDEEPLGPTDHIGIQRYFSIQFVQVLTNLWYSHTYNLPRYQAKLRHISKTLPSPKEVLRVYLACFNHNSTLVDPPLLHFSELSFVKSPSGSCSRILRLSAGYCARHSDALRRAQGLTLPSHWQGPGPQVCVECLIGKQNKPTLCKGTEPSSVPYRTPSACAKMAAYPDPPPVIPVPESESIAAQVQPPQVCVE